MRTLFIALALGIAIAYIRTNKKLPRQYIGWLVALFLMIWLWPHLLTEWAKYRVQHNVYKESAEIRRLRSELDQARRGDSTWTIVVRKDKPHYLPIAVGDSISFQRLDSVAYRLKLSNGRKFEVPLGLTGLLELPPSTRSISFELDSASTADSVRISIRKWRAKWT